jgi:ATP-dependent Lon protease
MPITLSSIPPKKSRKPKKQEDAGRTYKSNLNGPGPNAPQPPSPESDATTDNEDSTSNAGVTTTSATATTATTTATATAATTTATDATATATAADAVTSRSRSRSKNVANLAQRLEVNHLLAELYPSKHINQKVAALEKLSEIVTAEEESKQKTRGRKKPDNISTSSPEDPIAKAILDSAFKTPPSSPPNATNATNAPNAPSKIKPQKAEPKQPNKHQKQNYNIIIHVEPKSTDSDISRRLDFGNKVAGNKVAGNKVAGNKVAENKTAGNKVAGNKVTENKTAGNKVKTQQTKTPQSKVEDSDDDEYVPGCSDDDDETWDTYDEDGEDYDDYYDDDESYYSDSDSDSDSSESDDEDDAAEMEELDKQQRRFTEEMTMLQSLRTTYEDLLNKDKSNRIVANQLKTLKVSEEKIKTELEELTHKQKRKNSKKFRKLLRRKNSTNDLEYFKTRLTLSEQRAMISEMNAVAQVTDIEKPYKLTLLESDIPRDMKAVAIRKIGMLQYMEPGCGEYCKLKNWVDAFMQIPFNRNKNLPITIADGVDKCHDFMTAAKTHLDTAVYGLNDAKMQIMQMVGQWIANPAAIGTAVAIHGPPGTGKTSLVKEGISKILGRDFAFIALGGATDSSFLEGHSYTYEGSMWGKIVDILIRCKSSNPVIYFDELDKISETSKGEEIVGILTHLTDTSQNSQFHDKYFSEVAFDLSKCLFIFSYNDESRVNPVLLDRMYKIRTTGYSAKDKTFIAQHHLIPRICTEVAFARGDINIPDKVVEHIVEHHTHKEAGVRNLKRGLETIYTKLNLHRLMRPGTQLFDEKDKSFDVSFPYTVSCDVVDKLIKKNADGPNLTLYL